MPLHQVKQGDCISSIASAAGLLPELIWDHPDNADLKKKRKAQNVLFPGDLVFIPEKNVAETGRPTDACHCFRLKRTKGVLSVRFLRNNSPSAGEAYSLVVDGTRHPAGKLDADGAFNVRIPIASRRAVVTLGDPAREEKYILLLGHLDPVEETSGVEGRLANLGYCRLDDDGPTQDQKNLLAAVRAFQLDHALPTEGGIDHATRTKLKEAHGS